MPLMELESIRQRHEEVLRNLKKQLRRESERKLPTTEREIQERFSLNVQGLREKKGLNIGEVASLADVSRTYLWQIESRRALVNLEIATRIAKALGVTAYDLITRDGDW